ncbi:MAG: phosphodiester glycosidase family protein [Clostridia bacterium]|nr:phosphodiester glycosidase family protein [Clostridia bacterium]
MATYVRKKLNAAKIVKRSLLVFFTVLILIFLTLFSAGMMLANGPSETICKMLVISAKQASATKWLPHIFLSDERIENIMKESEEINVDEVDADSYAKDDALGSIEADDNGLKLIFFTRPLFKGYMLIVNDPSRVKVGVSSENFKSATRGARIFDIASKYNCLAAINGGEFSDIGGKGSGAQPMGITYSYGKRVWSDSLRRTFIGFDNNNNLVCTESMNEKRAEELGIRDGVSFQNGNVLIDSENGKIKLYYADNNTGTSQRTAIGQRKDGAILMLVTDGRSANSIGATRNDVIDIMVEYGAVSAGMLDGGSSAMLYYRNYYDIYDVDKSALDEFQLKGLVNKYKAFVSPRTIPTYFIVTE